jgi:hypothetical protein
MDTPVLYPGDRIHIAIWARNLSQADELNQNIVREYAALGVTAFFTTTLTSDGLLEPMRVLAVIRAKP